MPEPPATASRATATELDHESAVIRERLADSQAILDALPEIFAVLNEHRQIVYANHALMTMLEGRASACAEGKRPGEALNCERANEAAGGCGTAPGCATCGALQAILTSQSGERGVQECRITRTDGAALDLRVWATPLEVEGQSFTIFAVLDISDEKRRRILERIFFHDLLNTAGGLLGFTEMMLDANATEIDDFKQLLHRLAERLVDEIVGQRQLNAAERNELKLTVTEVTANSLLEDLHALYSLHQVCRDKSLVIKPDSRDLLLRTDPSLVRRVIGNMIKNALEAIPAHQQVTVGYRHEAEAVEFFVHNPGVMRPEVKEQVFQRSFSTKNDSRGVGAYSMKLLGERFLGGRVSFESSEAAGTTFRLRLPLELQQG